MADNRQAMYDRFSDNGAHFAEWFEITKTFMKLGFVGGCCGESCPCSMCENRKMSEYEMSAHLAKQGFMLNYLVWHQHGEVQPSAADESDRNNDEDQKDDMIADIGMGYDLGSGDPPMEVHNFYWLFAAS
jgi:hypothetical protein